MKKLFVILLSVLIASPIIEAKKPMRITILCYNIQIGKRADIDSYVEFAQKYNPDVIALQEVDYKTRRSTRHEDFAASLAERMGMNSVFGGNLHFSGGQYGLSLLSRFPIERVRAFTLPHPETAGERRGALSATLKINKKQKVNVINTHLDLNRDTRPEQVSAITEWVDVSSVPAVLCGDFNAMPEDVAISIAREHWTQMCDSLPTFPNTSPKRKIDYFFARGEGQWRTISYERVAECPLSDHCPIIITLEYIEDKK